jgi:amino acid transporter
MYGLSEFAVILIMTVPVLDSTFLFWAQRRTFFTPSLPGMFSLVIGHPSSLSYSLALNIFLPELPRNLNSWEAISTLAGEVAEPAKTLPRALAISVPLVVATYAIPTVAALGVYGGIRDEWELGFFARIANKVRCRRANLGFNSSGDSMTAVRKLFVQGFFPPEVVPVDAMSMLAAVQFLRGRDDGVNQGYFPQRGSHQS